MPDRVRVPFSDLPAVEEVRRKIHEPRASQESYWQVTTEGGREHFLIVAARDRLDEFEADLQRLPPAAPGRPILAAPLSEQAVGRLRSVGGLSGGSGTSLAGQQLFQFAQQLAADPETVTGT